MPEDMTWGALAVAVGLFAASVVGDRRPRAPEQLWYFPWKLVMALSLLAIMVLAGHLVTMLTGTQFRGRGGF